jgi:hypothetical protein
MLTFQIQIAKSASETTILTTICIDRISFHLICARLAHLTTVVDAEEAIGITLTSSISKFFAVTQCYAKGKPNLIGIARTRLRTQFADLCRQINANTYSSTVK